MSGCDYDGVFYRVFCVTLLGIAFTFTIILTNVFIDIDGLLASKQREKVEHQEEPIFIQETHEAYQENKLNNFESEFKNGDEDERNGYRNKRSLDTPAFQMHLKNPKMKKILTSRLAKLLEQLDAEESDNHGLFKENVEDNTQDSREIPDRRTAPHYTITEDNSKSHKDMLHLAMHNILLQGIIGHMDLMDVYKKVHKLIDHFEDKQKKDDALPYNLDESTDIPSQITSDNDSEALFFEEMTRCDRLHKEVDAAKKERGKNEKEGKNSDHETLDEGLGLRRHNKNTKGPNMLIKTIIDIKSLNDLGKATNDTNAENIKGVIKLIYNGHVIKFKAMDGEDTKNMTGNVKNDKKELPTHEVHKTTETESTSELTSDAHLRQAFADYLKNNLQISNGFSGVIKSRRKISKRMKRHVKVREHKRRKTHKAATSTPKSKNKGNDEEFYVEIETHFDDKGITGEKKRKLIKDIVDKIQKAIRADIDLIQSPKGKYRHGIIKKRVQNPLGKDNALRNKILIPIHEIGKHSISPLNNGVPHDNTEAKYETDNQGLAWKKTYLGPHFFSPEKAINSGEMGQVDLDYKNVMSNGIPQRLQQPLNTEGNDEPFDTNTYFDLGNLKFYIKELDGTGFSIGFNQYVGEPPDKESMDMFSGLKDLITTFHQNYDDKEITEAVKTRLVENPNAIEDKSEQEHKDIKKDANNQKAIIRKHTVKRRSTDIEDYHSNEYNIIFNNNFLPYDTYQEIYEDTNKTISVSLQKDYEKAKNDQQPAHKLGIFKKNIAVTAMPFVIDESILDRKLKPSEIFGLASLLQRTKRSLNVKKYAKINAKSKHATYLNTNVTKTKPRQFFIKKSRSKRQVYDKIRFIASDNIPNVQRRLDENFYVVSEENLAKRATALARDSDIEEREQPEQKSEERFDFVSAPFLPYDNRRIMPNFVQNIPNQNVFSARSRHNALMSKYPHIFMEEISHSKEEPGENPSYKVIDSFDVSAPDTVDDMNNVQKLIRTASNQAVQNMQPIIPVTEPTHVVKELYDAIVPKNNYKLTVKIQPKNLTDNPEAGFKETHTSINKSVSRNGMIYSSQVNVSEISKIEKDKNYTKTTTLSPIARDIRDQQEKMKTMLKAHKIKIEEQLEAFKEKQRLGNGSTKKPDTQETIDVVLPLNPPQLLHLNKDEARQLISSSLMKLHDTPLLNDLTAKHLHIDVNTSHLNITMASATPIPTVATTPYPTTKKSTPDPEKLRIIKTIQRNENLTNIILSKIDKNTEVLQLFLKRIADKFEPKPHTPETLRKKLDNFEHKYPSDWRPPYNHEPYFHNSKPNSEVNKNNTHAIPFVYAYQQPYTLNSNDKPNSPVANVVYRGHIHSNADLTKPPLFNAKPAILDSEKEFIHIPTGGTQAIGRSQGKPYFLDDNNSFKVMGDVKKPTSDNKHNGTGIQSPNFLVNT